MAYYGKNSVGTENAHTAAAGAIVMGLVEGAVGIAIIGGFIALVIVAIMAIVGA